MFIQLAAHERANSTAFDTRAPREQRQRQEHLFRQRTSARLARVVPFVIVRESATDPRVSGARDAIANIARVEAALLSRRH